LKISNLLFDDKKKEVRLWEKKCPSVDEEFFEYWRTVPTYDDKVLTGTGSTENPKGHTHPPPLILQDGNGKYCAPGNF
jgi:hypothetical protein